jgi:hypothetical protein
MSVTAIPDTQATNTVTPPDDPVAAVLKTIVENYNHLSDAHRVQSNAMVEISFALNHLIFLLERITRQ